jgi:hypothetical protein
LFAFVRLDGPSWTQRALQSALVWIGALFVAINLKSLAASLMGRRSLTRLQLLSLAPRPQIAEAQELFRLAASRLEGSIHLFPRTLRSFRIVVRFSNIVEATDWNYGRNNEVCRIHPRVCRT